MQNKGIITLFAVLLALISAYYLSFTLVTSGVRSDADKYANEVVERSGLQGVVEKENLKYDAKKQYLDSISTEPVYNFLGLTKFTFSECRSQEINLGLDLRGGMNVTLEVSVADVLTALSNYSTDSTFVSAINEAKKAKLTSRSDFITLFGQEFEKKDSGARLSNIFAFSLKDKIDHNSTNSEVLSVLRSEVKDAIDNSFNVLGHRIDRFGVVNPNIQNLQTQGQILVELPGVKEPERVRKLLQGTANLEFWTTYDAIDFINSTRKANEVVAAYLRKSNKVNNNASDTSNESAVDSVGVLDRLANAATGDTTALENSELNLFTYFIPNEEIRSGDRTGLRYNAPVIGSAREEDMDKVDEYLSLPQVKALFPRDLKLFWTVKPEVIKDDRGNIVDSRYYLIACKITTANGRAPLDGSVITDANTESDPNQVAGNFAVSMSMNAEGARVWRRITSENLKKSVAVVLDGSVYSYPTIQVEIKDGRTQITGSFTAVQANDLANLLKSGKMPAPARIIQESTVGPSLGEEAIQDGFRSFSIAFVVVLLYMLFYYGLTAGLIADIALLCNLFFLMGILVSFNAVLTLPGIAGIVLTIGMAVDANVLIYERIKEELASGKALSRAVEDGFRNAFSAIFDSNVTTIITGIVLAVFGSGPIKGFAITLIIGICTSFFCAVFISRLIFERFLKSGKNIDFCTSITKNWFKNVNFDFIGMRKIAYIISGTIFIAGIISLAFHGLDRGIDFTGGRTYQVRFDEPLNNQGKNTEDIRKSLKVVFDKVEVKDIGQDRRQVKISTNYAIASDDPEIDTKASEMLYDGLKDFLPANTSFEGFTGHYLISSDKVGPTIAENLKYDAIMAIFFSLIAISLYILLRFRTWEYSIGAVISLAHDVIILLGLYSLLYSIMPFSMQIDQAFIAAVLTVIGYSINDTVVIYDRLREYINLHPKQDRRITMNNAMNSTLGRTFSTSISTIVVVLMIFIFGGDVIRGFIFALLIGIFVGTYSSVFIATPVTYDVMRRKIAKDAEKAKLKK